MTCIAWDGKILATDTLSTMGGTVANRETEKVMVIQRPGSDDRILIAAAGRSDDAIMFRDWFRDKTNGNLRDYARPGDDFEAIVVSPHSLTSCWLFQGSPAGAVMPAPFAIGDGSSFAIAAMDLGKNAIEAVEYAMTRNVYTGGRVRAYTLEQGEINIASGSALVPVPPPYVQGALEINKEAFLHLTELSVKRMEQAAREVFFGHYGKAEDKAELPPAQLGAQFYAGPRGLADV